MNEVAWKQLEEEKANRVPTPPVGEPVVWYQGGDQRHPIPAQVSAIEESGRVTLKIHPANSFSKDVKGVYHVSHRIHDKPNNPQTGRCGAWDYPRKRIPKEDFTMHDLRIAERERQLTEAEGQAAKKAQEFQDKQAQRKAETKRHLPEILPAPF